MDEPREETMRRLAAERATTAAPKNKGWSPVKKWIVGDMSLNLTLIHGFGTMSLTLGI
jgi:hypothetical protein